MVSILRKLKRSIQSRTKKTEPNVLFWWGSFSGGGGATIGDLFAINNFSDELNNQGLRHSIVTHQSLPTRGHILIDRTKQLRRNIKTLAFVCGPLLDDPQFRALLKDHTSAGKVAAGVSILPSSRSIASEFDTIIARDGTDDSHFDLAISEIVAPMPPGGRRLKIGLCYRGHQGEYGEATRWAEAQSILDGIAEAQDADRIEIDTVLREDNSADNILGKFRAADIILTTRLHGALFSLAQGKPVIVIDQIAGTGKVKPVMDKIAWPGSFSIDGIDTEAVRHLFERFLVEWPVEEVRTAQSEIMRRSTEARLAAASAFRRLAQ